VFCNFFPETDYRDFEDPVWRGSAADVRGDVEGHNRLEVGRWACSISASGTFAFSKNNIVFLADQSFFRVHSTTHSFPQGPSSW